MGKRTAKTCWLTLASSVHLVPYTLHWLNSPAHKEAHLSYPGMHRAHLVKIVLRFVGGHEPPNVDRHPTTPSDCMAERRWLANHTTF